MKNLHGEMIHFYAIFFNLTEEISGRCAKLLGF